MLLCPINHVTAITLFILYSHSNLGPVEDDELAGVGRPGPTQLSPLVLGDQGLPHSGPVPGPGGQLAVTQQRAINTVQT